MKNTHKILFFFALAAFLFSCEEDDNLRNEINVGANVLLKTTSLTKFDINDNVKLEFIPLSGIKITKSVVEFEGQKAELTISEDPKTSRQIGLFSSSIFGDLYNAKSPLVFKVSSTLSNGKTMSQYFKISVNKNVLSIVKKQNISNLIYMSKIPDTLAFKTTTNSAIINSVTLDWKKNKSGTYATTSPTGKALKVKGDSIIFTNVDETTYTYGLKVKDTLYYKFIATSGSLKDTLEVIIPVSSQNFSAYSDLKINSDLSKNKLNLKTGAYYANDDAKGKGEIKFKSPSGFEKEATTAIDFVKVGDLSGESIYLNTPDKFYNEKDLLAIKKLYDSGTKTTSVDSPSLNEMYLYKITRDTEVSYGLIKIENVSTNIVNGVSSTSISISSGEGGIN